MAPRAIKGDGDLDVVGTIVKDAGDLARKVEGVRKAEKEPFLQGGRDVDAFFKTFTDRLERIRVTFQTIGDDYTRAKAAEARRVAEEAARKAREEEAARMELARKAAEDNRGKHAEQHIAKADEAELRAEAAETIAKSSAADLTRTRTASGTLATAKTEWTFEIENYDAIPVDKLRTYIKRDAIEAAIRLFVKMGNRELAGVRIFEDVKASFR